MIKETELFSKSTKSDDSDPVEMALQDLRVAGSIVLHEVYRAPWAIEIPDEETLRQLLGVSQRVRVFPFHLVKSGGFRLDVAGHGACDIAADTVAVCMSGSTHRMEAGGSKRAIPLVDLIKEAPALESPSNGEPSELICGVFFLAERPFNPLLAGLPPVMTAPVLGTKADPVLQTAVSLLSTVLNAKSESRAFVSSRVLEIFCAELIRQYARTPNRAGPGWFHGLNDPKIGAALRLIHRDRGRAWTVRQLAATVSLSPSRFAGRFREKVGQSVQRYLISQRMALACEILERSSGSIADVSYTVGYGSMPAFSRAFTEHLGLSPREWRKQAHGSDVQPGSETVPAPGV